MKVDDFVERIDKLLDKAEDLLQRAKHEPGHEVASVDSAGFVGLRSAGLSLLANLFEPSHPYYREFDMHTGSPRTNRVKQAIEILSAAKEELAGGWFRKARGLVAAEIFTDFLDMAEHLLSEDYRDAAAVITGSVLEEHLRQLAGVHSVETTWTNRKGNVLPKKADTLNADLAKAGAYNNLDHKAITGWLDLRNKAAHGKYDEYTTEQVRLMHQGVLDFTTRVPT